MGDYSAILDLLKIRLKKFCIRLTIVKNLALITYAFLCLSSGGRSGNGKISLSAIERNLYSDGTGKSKFKRLSRFLKNKFFKGEVIVPCLINLVIGGIQERFIPVIVDQTTIGSVQVIMAGVLFSGRVIPIAFWCYLYEKIYKSQNWIETGFLRLITASFPMGYLPVFTMNEHTNNTIT